MPGTEAEESAAAPSFDQMKVATMQWKCLASMTRLTWRYNSHPVSIVRHGLLHDNQSQLIGLKLVRFVRVVSRIVILQTAICFRVDAVRVMAPTLTNNRRQWHLWVPALVVVEVANDLNWRVARTEWPVVPLHIVVWCPPTTIHSWIYNVMWWLTAMKPPRDQLLREFDQLFLSCCLEYHSPHLYPSALSRGPQPYLNLCHKHNTNSSTALPKSYPQNANSPRATREIFVFWVLPLNFCFLHDWDCRLMLMNLVSVLS